MKKSLIFILFISFFFIINPAYAALKISPSRFELNAGKKNYISGCFSLKAGKDETIRFKIYPGFFEISSKGKIDLNVDKTNERSLVNHIRFVPSEFTLKEGKEQKIRFTLTDIASLPDGESRLVLFLEDLNTKELFLKAPNNKSSSRINVKTRLGVPIYLDKGKVVKSARIDDLKVQIQDNKVFASYKIASTGNSKIRYNAIGQIIDGKSLVKEFDLKGYPVQGGGFVNISDIVPIEGLESNKEYKLRIIVNYLDQKQSKRNLKKEVIFTTDNKLIQQKI